MLFEAGYLDAKGHKLVVPSSRTINQVRPELIRLGDTQALRPFPRYSNVTIVQQTFGNSN